MEIVQDFARSVAELHYRQLQTAVDTRITHRAKEFVESGMLVTTYDTSPVVDMIIGDMTAGRLVEIATPPQALNSGLPLELVTDRVTVLELRDTRSWYISPADERLAEETVTVFSGARTPPILMPGNVIDDHTGGETPDIVIAVNGVRSGVARYLGPYECGAILRAVGASRPDVEAIWARVD